MKPGLIAILFFTTMFSGCIKHDTSPHPSIPDIPDNLKTGLIAMYLFNGNANDESGNNYNSVVKEAVLTEDRFDIPNKAYRFNGLNQYIVIPKIILADSLKQVTISLWINPTTAPLTNANVMVSFNSMDSTSPCSDYFSLLMNGGRYETWNGFITKARPYNCTTALATDSFPIPSGNWHHLVFVSYIAEESLPYFQYYQYLNGVKSTKLSRSDFNPLLLSFSQGGSIGADSKYPVADRFFHGSIDDIRIYNRVLSDAEVLQLYNLK